jgi:DNA-binding response OmpR family regulator
MPNPNVAVVVEDDADIRSLIVAILEQAGFEVHPASGGFEGISLVDRHDPAVTTLDVSMPGIDGFETARRIRAFSGTRILMVSARADETEERAGRDAGADDYLTKPFRPRELRDRVRLLVTGGSAAGA